MKYITHFFLILSICLIGTSCFKERIELDLNTGDNKLVVVTAWFTNLDEPQYVLLNYTSDYFDSLNVEYINNADVSLTYDGQEIILFSVGNGKYDMPNDWRGEVGNTYTLEVRHDNTTYSATSTLRAMPAVENVYAELDEERFEKDSIEVYEIFFSFEDFSGEGDGYFGIDYLKNTLGGDTMVYGDFIDDEFIDGTSFEDVSLTDRDYVVGDTVILELNSIGKDASRFLQDIRDETFREGLFDPTPVNVRSNFTNGALGYFITSGTERVEVIIE